MTDDQTTDLDMSDYLVRQALAEPMDWESWRREMGRPIHEWRVYVTDEVRALWHTFTPEQKVAVMRMADEMAGREQWD